MAKWGTYPPDEQLRLKRNAAEELYEALEAVLSDDDITGGEVLTTAREKQVRAALAKARGQ